MSPRSACRRLPRLAGLGAAVAALLFSAGWVGPTPRPPSHAIETFWQTGVARPIAVDDGRATVRIPTQGPASQTLVVVSALSRKRGPFPIRVEARHSDRAEIPGLADDGTASRRAITATTPSTTTPTAPPPGRIPPRTRTFHLLVRAGDPAGTENYAEVEAILRGVGRRVQVYVDPNDVDAVDRATIADIITTFDDQVFPEAARHLAPARDIDGDGRFTVLLSGWLGKLGGGRFAVDGFVKVADFEDAVPSPFGNRCDMMYLNAAIPSGSYLRSIMAHEYRHAVIYTCKTLGHSGGPTEEGWLDEAIAHIAEDELGFGPSNVDYRIGAFLSDPSRYRLVVDDYFAADLFRSHGNRGSTYLFLRWCVDRYGAGLIPALVMSPERGIANIEAATGATFADLFRRWTLAMFRDGRDPPASKNIDDYRSIDLHAPLDDRELAGPRFRRMMPGDPPESWAAEGTSTHYLIIDGASTGAVEIKIVGPKDAEIQVTVLPLGDDRARLDVSAQVIRDGNGDRHVMAVATERNGVPVRLSGLAWEPLVPGRRDGPGERLDMLGIASTFGTSALPAGGSLQSRPIPMPGVQPGSGPIIVKLVGTDPRGRRVAGWTEVAPE